MVENGENAENVDAKMKISFDIYYSRYQYNMKISLLYKCWNHHFCQLYEYQYC